MTRILTRLLARMRRDTEASAAIEFVVIFPIFVLFALVSFETGIFAARQAMLDRGVDMSVRAIRLSTDTPPSYDDLRDMICAGSSIIPNCENSVKVEMIRFDPYSGYNVPDTIQCKNRAEEIDPVRTYEIGGQNQMMLIRVCALVEPVVLDVPLFANSGKWSASDELPEGYKQEYVLLSQSVYVTEPNG